MKYKYIYGWGKLLNSRDYYIISEMDKAIKDNAPEKAIYQKDDGTWATLDDVKDPMTRAEVERLAA